MAADAKVPVLLFDRKSGDCEIVFVTSHVLTVTLNGKEFKVAVDKNAIVNVAAFMGSDMFTMYVHDVADAQHVLHAKFKRDIMSHTLFRKHKTAHCSVGHKAMPASRLCNISV